MEKLTEAAQKIAPYVHKTPILTSRSLNSLTGSDIYFKCENFQALQWFFQRMKIVVEPSGAVPLAALFEKKLDVKGKKVGLIVSGGNIDLKGFLGIL